MRPAPCTGWDGHAVLGLIQRSWSELLGEGRCSLAEVDLVNPCAVAYRHHVKMASPARRRSVLLSFRFATVAAIGSLAMALVVAFAPLDAQLGLLGSLISVLAGLVVSYVEQEDERDRQRTELLTLLSVPVALSADR